MHTYIPVKNGSELESTEVNVISDFRKKKSTDMRGKNGWAY
jgi:hypothetical protein